MFRECISISWFMFSFILSNTVFASTPDWKKCEYSARTVEILAEVLEEYKEDKSSYPNEKLGVEILLREGYLKRIPEDAWGRQLIYAINSNNSLNLGTLGADGQAGGKGFKADYFLGYDKESYIDGCKKDSGLFWWVWW